MSTGPVFSEEEAIAIFSMLHEAVLRLDRPAQSKPETMELFERVRAAADIAAFQRDVEQSLRDMALKKREIVLKKRKDGKPRPEKDDGSLAKDMGRYARSPVTGKTLKRTAEARQRRERATDPFADDFEDDDEPLPLCAAVRLGRLLLIEKAAWRRFPGTDNRSARAEFIEAKLAAAGEVETWSREDVKRAAKQAARAFSHFNRSHAEAWVAAYATAVVTVVEQAMGNLPTHSNRQNLDKGQWWVEGEGFLLFRACMWPMLKLGDGRLVQLMQEAKMRIEESRQGHRR